MSDETITVVSMTESKEVAAPIKSEAAPKDIEVDNKSASGESQDETKEVSETSKDDSQGEESQDDKEVSASDDEEGEEQSQESDGKTKKRNGFRKRIDKLTKRVSEKDREVEYWKQQALKGAPKSEEPKKTESTAPNAADRPVADNFDSHEAYIDAVTDWKVKQTLKARDTEQKEAVAKIAYEKSVAEFQESVQTFKKAHNDFDEVLDDVEDIPVSLAVRDLIIRSQNGPELMYELAKDKKEFKRINELDALQAAREFGKFEAKLKKEAALNDKDEAEIKKTTKAPRPLSTVGKGGTSSMKKSIYDPNLSQTEYESLRREQAKARRA